MSDLLPCPFCGGAPQKTPTGAIVCENQPCSAIVGVPSDLFKNGFDPVKAWNTRAPRCASVESEAKRQMDAIDRLSDTEDADIDFLVSMLGLNPHWEKGRKIIKSFREQIISVTASHSPAAHNTKRQDDAS